MRTKCFVAVTPCLPSRKLGGTANSGSCVLPSKWPQLHFPRAEMVLYVE